VVSDLQYVAPRKNGVNTIPGTDVLVVGTLGRGVYKLTGAEAKAQTDAVLQVGVDDLPADKKDLGHEFVLWLDPSQPAGSPPMLDVFRDGQLLGGGPVNLAAVDSITITGGGGNDTLFLDPRIRLAGNIAFNGGGGRNGIYLLGDPGTVFV